jgi:hypothetical protein
MLSAVEAHICFQVFSLSFVKIKFDVVVGLKENG